MNTAEGACYCGAITYRIDTGIKRAVNCHCNMCRSMNGGAFSSYAIIFQDALKLKGEEHLSTFRPTSRTTKHFCKLCGTPVFNLNSKHPGLCMLYLGTLNDHKRYLPAANVWSASMLKWVSGINVPVNIPGSPRGGHA